MSALGKTYVHPRADHSDILDNVHHLRGTEIYISLTAEYLRQEEESYLMLPNCIFPASREGKSRGRKQKNENTTYKSKN